MYDKKYGGMTVNERLYVSGNMPNFDKAVKEKNIEKMIEMLKSVELSETNIGAILEHYGLKQ